MAGVRYYSLAFAVVFLTLATTAYAQVDSRLSAYTGRNASGYLDPLVEAFRSNLNAGLFHTAYVPEDGFHVGLEVNVMSTFFGASSRTFWATTEGDFLPQERVEAPTVIGDTHAVVVNGDAGTQFAFPGGFNVDRFYFTCPQVTVGSWKGTEVLGRFILVDTGISDLGTLRVWGAGLRHSVSQYVSRLAPFDLALAGYWQVARLRNASGDNVIDSRLGTVSLQTGVRLGPVYPYGGLSVNWFLMDVNYRSELTGLEPISLELRPSSEVQMTLGVSWRVAFLAAYGEYNVADQNSVAAGLSVNFPSTDRSVTQ